MSQKVTRFEVIDTKGRVYVADGVSIRLSYQDGGCTLKVFVREKGAVKTRSQIRNPITGTWTKRDDKSGKFIDAKADPRPFKGVRKEKKR